MSRCRRDKRAVSSAKAFAFVRGFPSLGDNHTLQSGHKPQATLVMKIREAFHVSCLCWVHGHRPGSRTFLVVMTSACLDGTIMPMDTGDSGTKGW